MSIDSDNCHFHETQNLLRKRQRNVYFIQVSNKKTCFDLKLREVCFSNNERNNKVLINEKMFKDMLFR